MRAMRTSTTTTRTTGSLCVASRTPLFYSQLVQAYYDARRHKRNTVNQLEFECNLDENLVELAHELENRTYKLKPSVCFISTKPVKREIIAANFRDRVVHHLLYNWIYPVFDRQFIYDSYSCRKGKGTLFGIKRAAHFIKSESRNFMYPCYVLRLDISGFFMSIDRDVLYRLCIEGLYRTHWKEVPDKDLCVFLLKTFIYNDPLKDAVFRSSEDMWSDLPRNKSLRYTQDNCGLPIGNLTSQLFGNVYLNPLDQFVKRDLRIHCYGRYVDDMVLVHRDKSILLDATEKIRNYLEKNLSLQLHPNKVYLQNVQHGFSFLGAFILPWRIYPSRRLVKSFKRCLKCPWQPAWRQKNRVISYCGLLGHFNSFNLLRRN